MSQLQIWATNGLRVTVHARSTKTVVSVHGEVDDLSVATLQSALLATVATTTTVVVIDLENVDFFGAAGLGALVAARNAGVATGHTRIIVTGASALTTRIFAITNLRELFDIRPGP